MTQTVLKQKVARYLAYADDLAWQDPYPYCPPMLLLTATATRAASFVRVAEQVLVRHRHRTDDNDRGCDVRGRRLRARARPARAVTEPCWALARWLNWLTQRGYHNLSEVDSECCEAYLAHRRHMRDDDGTVIGDHSPAIRRAAAQTVVDLVNYRDLFSTDRVRADLHPWGGAAPSAVAEMPCGRGQNKTPPVDDSVLQPLLAAPFYLVSTLGPLAVALVHQVREATRAGHTTAGAHAPKGRVPIAEITRVLDDYETRGVALPLLPAHHVRDRLASGWSPDDPLTPIALGLLARQAGFDRFHICWVPHLRDAIQATLRIVSAEGLSAAWPLPCHGPTVRAACPGHSPCTDGRPSPWSAWSAPPPSPSPLVHLEDTKRTREHLTIGAHPTTGAEVCGC